MSLAFAVALVLSASPKLESIPAPFGYAGRVVTDPSGGTLASERRVVATPPGCSEKQAYHLTVLVSAALKAVEQLQAWLDRQPGLEERLFKGHFKLAEVTRLTASSIPSELHACKAPALAGGYQLGWASVPKLCDGEVAGPWGDYWWATKGTPAAVVQLSAPRAPPKGKADAGEELPIACRPRFSVLLFDEKGVARVRWNAEYLGNLTITLLGEGCQQVDFALDLPSVAFKPVIRPARGCKAQ